MLLVGEELYLANTLIGNVIWGCVLVAKYISAFMALRYGTSVPTSSSLPSHVQNKSFFTLGVLNSKTIYVKFNS